MHFKTQRSFSVPTTKDPKKASGIEQQVFLMKNISNLPVDQFLCSQFVLNVEIYVIR